LKNETPFPIFHLHKPTSTGKNKFARLFEYGISGGKIKKEWL
jgi:hypothetical protein